MPAIKESAQLLRADRPETGQRRRLAAAVRSRDLLDAPKSEFTDLLQIHVRQQVPVHGQYPADPGDLKEKDRPRGQE